MKFFTFNLKDFFFLAFFGCFIFLMSCGDDDTPDNQAPVIDDQRFTVSESATTNTLVGTIEVSDPEDDIVVVTILSGNESGAFILNPATFQLSVALSTALSFESTPTYTLSIQASDERGATSNATITVNVTEASSTDNRSPVINDQFFTIPEDIAAGSEVTVVTASDPDGDDLTYTITSGNTDDVFRINENTGAITVNNATPIDAIAIPSYALEINVGDGEFNVSATITINVTPVSTNQAPNLEDQTFQISENAPVGTQVGILEATDPDGDAITYSISSGNTRNAFSLDANTGTITIANALDFDTNPEFTLLVLASDGELSDEAEITINIIKSNTPVPLTFQGTTYSMFGALLEDWGLFDLTESGGATHYNYSFYISDADYVFDSFEGFYFPDANASIEIFTDLFAAGNAFQVGTFDYVSPDAPLSEIEGNSFFDFVTVTTLDKTFLATDGNIVVSSSATNVYELTYNLTVQEAVFDSQDEFAGVIGDPIAFSYTFEGTFLVDDISSRATSRRTSNESKKRSRFKK